MMETRTETSGILEQSQAREMEQPEHPIGKIPRVEWPSKLKRVRDYSHGSIRELIQRAETEEELEEVRQFVIALAAEGKIARRTLRKIEASGRAKAEELSKRLLITPPRHGGLLVPKHMTQPGGSLIVRP